MACPALRPLRWWQLWMTLGCLLLAVVMAGSLMPHPERLLDVRIWDKAQHAGAYVVLAGWFGCIYRRRYHALVALALVAFGVLIEILQNETGRDFEYADMLADAIGVAIGLVVAATPVGLALVWVEHRLLRV